MNTQSPRRSPWPWLVALALLVVAIQWHRGHGASQAAAASTQSAALPGRTTAQSEPLPPLSGHQPGEGAHHAAAADGLPPQAHDTLRLIVRGGPFPYRQDGVVFGNREGRLPDRPYGYYHEYTVVTPGAPTRGTRRIITGGDPPQAWYYTDDHYRSFRSIEPDPR